MASLLISLSSLSGKALAEKIYDTDLLIVGSGVAGLTAAAHSTQNGIKTLLIEKNNSIGGQLKIIGGTFAVESSIQRKNMIGATKKEAFRSAMDYSGWKANSSLVKRIIDLSNQNIEWLIASGIEMGPVIEDKVDGLRAYHTYASDRPGKPFIDAMMKIIDANNGAVLTDTSAQSLITNDKGEVIGVWAQSKTDGKIRINAKAVLLATGSVGHNRELLKNYNPTLPENIKTNAIKTNTGDGIVMGQAIGADVANMDMFISESTVAIDTEWAEQLTNPVMKDAYMINKTFSLWVNKNGDRYVNEALAGDFTIVSNSLRQNGNIQIVIMDDDKRQALMKTTGADTNYFRMFERGRLITHFDEVVEDGQKRGYAFKANSIEELAQKLNIPPQKLKATVDRYNLLAQTKEDVDQGKDSRYMQPIVKAPFYAFLAQDTICDSVGGLKINHNAQVLNTKGEPIKGLYAAGATAGGMYGDNYPYVLPGFASTMSMVTGYLALEHFALEELNKKTSFMPQH